jgi:hypothetical protein
VAVVINNGLAPPSPDNVIDDSLLAGDGIYVRNVGCGTPAGFEASPCASPGAPTEALLTDGGDVSTFYIMDTSIGRIDGGLVTSQAQTHGSATLVMEGGTVVNYLGAHGAGRTELHAGDVQGFLSAAEFSTVAWYGGTVGGQIRANNNARLLIHGHDFAVDGTPVPYGDLDSHWVGQLTGTLFSGEAIDNRFIHRGYVGSPSSLTGMITLVPEPGTGVLLGVGLALAAVSGRRHRGAHRRHDATVSLA